MLFQVLLQVGPQHLAEVLLVFQRAPGEGPTCSTVPIEGQDPVLGDFHSHGAGNEWTPQALREIAGCGTCCLPLDLAPHHGRHCNPIHGSGHEILHSLKRKI